MRFGGRGCSSGDGGDGIRWGKKKKFVAKKWAWRGGGIGGRRLVRVVVEGRLVSPWLFSSYSQLQAVVVEMEKGINRSGT